MATFTIELYRVFESTDGHIGLDDYPIFDESYRVGLNTKIFEHFYNREIGQETVDMFRLFMRRKMNEIMPYYNQLYRSAALTFDPFITFETSTSATTDGTSGGTTTSSSDATNTSVSTSKARTVGSDTPQTRLSGDEDYATSVTDANSETDGSGTAHTADTVTQTGTQGGTATTHANGFTGSRAQLLMEFRQTFLNIDLMVIAELETLFMQIWSNGDEFSRDAAYPFYF